MLGSVLRNGLCDDLTIVSDDAGQFAILRHALCWVHTERLIHKMLPLNETHRVEIARIRDQIWRFYAQLKRYKSKPDKTKQKILRDRFNEIFSQKTSYVTLNQTLKRIHNNKAELLVVLDRPEIPLHTNGSETDIRDYVKKRKVSGGTRSDEGRRCRDTFASLKKTCRKLDISFWHYITNPRHRRFATEGALLGSVLRNELWRLDFWRQTHRHCLWLVVTLRAVLVVMSILNFDETQIMTGATNIV